MPDSPYPNPPPFTSGASKVVGGFDNLEIKRAPFQVRQPNFSRGGWILIKEMHSPGFEKYRISKFLACGGLFLFVFAYLMNQFSKFFACSGHFINFQ